jgi:hypothetical protein
MLLRLHSRSESRMFPVSLQTLVLALCWIEPCGQALLGPTDSESGLRLAGFSFIQGDLIPVLGSGTFAQLTDALPICRSGFHGHSLNIFVHLM